MSMWYGDFTGQTPETMDDSKAPVGWHLATLVKASEDPTTGKLETSWRIDSPLGAGSLVHETFNNPSLAQTEKEMAGQAKRFRVWVIRCGLVKKEDAGKRVQVDPTKAVGVQRVIHCVLDEYTDQQGKTRQSVKIEYAGIFPTDRTEIPVEARQALGLPLLPGQTPPALYADPKAPAKGPPPPAQTAFDPSEV